MNRIFAPLVAVAIGMLLFGAGRASASCYHAPVYHAPAKKVAIVKEIVTPIIQQVAVPVLVPAYQFQYSPAYAYPPQAFAQTPAYQPLAAGYGVPHTQPSPVARPPMAAPPTAANQQQFQNNDIQQLARLLINEMQKQSGQQSEPVGYQDDGPPVAIVPGQQPSYPPTPYNPNPPGTGTGRPNPQSQFSGMAFAALQKNCASCHTGAGSRGDTIIFSQPGVLDSNAPFKSMHKEIAEGRMPTRSSQWQPTPEERAAMLAWLSGQ